MHENLVATQLTPSPSMGPVSGALQGMFQVVRELSVAAFGKAPPQEKLMSCGYSQKVRLERIRSTMDLLIK